MTRTLLAFTALSLVALPLSGCASSASADDELRNGSISDTIQSYGNMSKEHAKAVKTAADARKDIRDAEKDLKDARKETSKAEKDMRDARDDLEKARRKLRTAEDTRQRIERTYERSLAPTTR